MRLINPIKVAKNFNDIREFFSSDTALTLERIDQEIDIACQDKQLVPGFCNICNCDSNFSVYRSDGYFTARETFLCTKCILTNRHRTLLIPIINYLDNSTSKTIWLAEHNTSFALFLENRYQNQHQIITSSYDSAINSRHENIESLNFADESLDMVITADVIEHVNDPGAAWRECFRVLKPGGRNIFTIPLSKSLSEEPISVTRCKQLPNGTIEHYLLPPIYHNGEYLSYTDFGFDILDINKQIGYQETLVEYYWNQDSFLCGLRFSHCIFHFIK